jgi:hypothetical protein
LNIRLKLFLFSILISISCVVLAQSQTVSSNLSLDYLYDGKTTDLTVSYRATDSFSDSVLVTGLGLRLHFDSSALQVGDVKNLFLDGAQGSGLNDDTSNVDNDTSTDKYFLTSWADFGGDWPDGENQPIVLYTLPFTALSGFNGSTLKFTASSTAAGYTLESDDISVLLDTVPPSISLIGSDIISLVGASYVDAGATALDNVDGDISDNIVSTTNVDINSVGTYFVRYNVSDGNGNAAAEVTRIVTITYTDIDEDGIADINDNCINDANSDQLDTDNDNLGDVCDSDDDADGVPDENDVWPLRRAYAHDPDRDGLPSRWETRFNLMPLNTLDAELDEDGDGLTALEEFSLGTNPRHEDTDLDGLPDEWELLNSKNPTISNYQFKVLLTSQPQFEASCLLDDKDLRCVGLWDNQTVPEMNSPPLAVAVAANTACAIFNLNIECWGRTRLFKSDKIQNVDSLKFIGAERNGFCVLGSSDLVCWGQSFENLDGYSVLKKRFSEPYSLIVEDQNVCVADAMGLHCSYKIGQYYEDRAWCSLPIEAQIDGVLRNNNSVATIVNAELSLYSVNECKELDIANYYIPSAEEFKSPVVAGYFGTSLYSPLHEAQSCIADDGGSRMICWKWFVMEESAVIETPPFKVLSLHPSDWAGSYCVYGSLGFWCDGEDSLELQAFIDPDGDGFNTQGGLDKFPLDAAEWADTDNDGIGDNADVFPDNALYSVDSDSDGMPDEWETKYGLDPNDASDATSDQDNDGVTALDEFLAGTIPSGSLDIDGNENYDALTDGLLFLRGMFGLDGSALVTGTIASDAAYTESVDIESRIATLGELADIDGNGQIDALTDGLLTLRYLFGLQGDTLINEVVADDATRKTAEEIEAHLETLMPAL